MGLKIFWFEKRDIAFAYPDYCLAYLYSKDW